MLVLLLMMASILVLLMGGISIAVSLGGAGIFWLILKNPNLLLGVGHATWNSTANYMLVSIPLFVLMGELIQRSSIGNHFYSSTSRFVRWLPGGMLHANIASCAMFSTVSGSSVATAATVGTSAIPSLLRLGYPRRAVFGSLAAGGTLGILIPPSIPLILYAALTNVSLGKLFIGAVVPAAVILLMFTLYIALSTRTPPAQTPDRDDTTLAAAFGNILPILVIFGIIFVGIYSGLATPTEVAAIGAVVAALMAAAKRELTWPVVRDSLVATAQFTSMVMLILIGAQIFSYALLAWGVPREVSSWIGELTSNPYLVIAAVILLYLVLGMFIEPISMMVLTLSVVFPIVTQAGWDGIWFGIVLVLLLEVGLLTPPVGMNLYIIQGIAPKGTTFQEVLYGTVPYIILIMTAIILIVIFPQIVLWLPGTSM